MNKKITRIFTATIIGLLIFCIIVFMSLTRYMTKQNTDTLNTVADTYMEGMSTQIQKHFETLVDMRMIQVESIVQAFPPESVEKMDEEAKEWLTQIAQLRQFTHLSLYNTQGGAEVIYGNELEIENKEAFMQAMNDDRQMVTIGIEEDGTSVLLYGISVGYPNDVGYPMSDGSHCTALVVGLPIERLSEALSIGTESSLMFTHIIRSDGTFVVNNSDVEITTDSCFDWLLLNGQEAGMEILKKLFPV